MRRQCTNTQPWRFRVGRNAIELYAAPRRKLRVDPADREMLISCGGALFGLRVAVRSLGYLPVVELLPDPARLRLLPQVRMGAAPMTALERGMLEAIPHRHTHRGPFASAAAVRLLAGLQHSALAEGATLALVDRAITYQNWQTSLARSATWRRFSRPDLCRSKIRFARGGPRLALGP